MNGPSRSPEPNRPTPPRRARPRSLSTKVPLIVSLVAGLATMIVPTVLQRRAMSIRMQIVREIQPAQRTVGRLQRALTAEVAVEFLYAQLPADTLLHQRQRARKLTDTYLAKLDAIPGGLGDTLSRDSRALRATLAEWRRDLDALAAGLLTPGTYHHRLLARQAVMAELLARTDSLRDALDGAAVSRRNVIIRLSRQSMAGNVSLALLALASVLGVAWLTRQEHLLADGIARRAEEERALSEIARELSGAGTVLQISERITLAAITHTRATAAYVERVVSPNRRVEVIAERGLGPPPSATHFPYTGSITEQLSDNGVSDVQAGAADDKTPAYLRERCPDCNRLVVPLRAGRELLGALVLLGRSGSAAYRNDELRRARTLGAMCAWALQRALLADAVAKERTEKAIILDSAGDGIYTISASGAFSFLNRAGALMLGYSPGEVIGRNAHALIHHSHADGTPYLESDCPIFAVTRMSEGTRVTDEVAWTKDGRCFRADYTSFPLSHEAVHGAVVTFRDATERIAAARERERMLAAEQEAHQAAEQLMASRSRLMRGFTHDVKNPLGAADGYATLLLDGAYGALQDTQTASVERIRDSLQNALGLIEELNEFARVDVGELGIQLEQVTLRELLAALVEEYRAGAAQKALALTIDGDHAPETLRTDGRRLRQILGNLISNAIKYTDVGSVTVRLTEAATGPSRQDGRWIELAVTDTGIGIPDEKLDQLFKEFSRLDADDRPGAGLGLAISQRLAEALGGKITVRSTAGHGTTFTLWLPIND